MTTYSQSVRAAKKQDFDRILNIIARFSIAPFIVTLGSLSAVRGLVYVISEVPVVHSDPEWVPMFCGPL